ncbi:MAG: hypothetical protein JW712_08785 [Dehalococcoidales bacterium]|nr:hypothetical protein [Dehalococcoidales bacterium]
MLQNSRNLVADFFKGKSTERPPFMPWVCRFAAKLEQVPVKSMLTDPGVLARALSNAHKLFGYDVILNHFDSTLEAEACGCGIAWPDSEWPPVISSHPLEDGTDFYDLDTDKIEDKGRIPLVMEATKRLILTKGKEVPVAAMVTGPLTLARHLKGKSFLEGLEQEDDEALDLVEDTGSICLKLCRAYCELGVDIVVVAEDFKDMMISDVAQMLGSPLKSMFNVARFYEVNSVLIGRAADDEQAVALCGLGADAVSISGSVEPDKVREKAREVKCGCSVVIPDSSFTGTDFQYADAVSGVNGPGLFLSSEWEVPYDTDVTSMHEIMKCIRS